MNPGGRTIEVPADYRQLKYETIYVNWVNTATGQATSDGLVVQLTLNRPPVNSFTQRQAYEIAAAFELFNVDRRVKCIIITAHGDKFFGSGADLSDPSALEDGDGEGQYRDGGGIASLAISRCRKPVIAAIQGHAIGVGITMTLGCAIRLVSSTAKVGFVFTRRGLVMEACSSFFLPRLIGYSRATRLVTTGEILLAGDKAFGGLFTEVIDGGAEKVRERARYCAEMIASETSTVASYLCRSMIWHGPPTVEEAHLLESRALGHALHSKDKSEGFAAFLEKRRANYTATVEDDLPAFAPWWTSTDTGRRNKHTVVASSKL